MSQQPILADVLHFVEKAGAALHASRELAESVASEREKVAAMLPVDAEAMTSTSASCAGQLGAEPLIR